MCSVLSVDSISLIEECRWRTPNLGSLTAEAIVAGKSWKLVTENIGTACSRGKFANRGDRVVGSMGECLEGSSGSGSRGTLGSGHGISKNTLIVVWSAWRGGSSDTFRGVR